MAERPRFRSRVSPVAVDADLLALAGADGERPVFYFERPDSGRAVAAAGSVLEVTAAGPGRFAEASAAALSALGAVEGGEAPPAVGGFAFSDHDPDACEWREFPALRLFVPRRSWIRDGQGAREILVWRDGEDPPDTMSLPLGRHRSAGASEGEETLAPAVSPPHPPLCGHLSPRGRGGLAGDAEERRRWGERVEAIRTLIAAGTLEKAVIARRRRLRMLEALEPETLLRELRAARPSCWSFWMATGETSFLGSTPELLVRRAGPEVASGALAGSGPRGATPEEDGAAGQRLLACPKNRHEHALVADAVRAALAPFCERLDGAASPGLLRLPETHHLYTPLTGRLREPVSVLELAARLHPTPAVCGVPRERARRLIDRDEPDRGWYAGGIGWMDAQGDGELAVTLRSALVDGATVTIRAGAGIVAGSDAASEYAETEAKLAAIFRDAVRMGNGRAA